MATNWKFGYEGKLYFGSAILTARPPDAGSTFSNVTWTEIDNVTDVDGDFEANVIDTTTRAEAKFGWASEVRSIRKATLKFSMRWKPSDAGFTKLRDAWLTNSEVAMLDLDGKFGAAADSGNQGVVGNFTVSFNKKAAVAGLQMVEVTISGSTYLNWVSVNGSGALVAV